MKAYSIYYDQKDGVEDHKWGSIIVVAGSITKAIATFQKEYHPDRIISSVTCESQEVLVDLK
jgi:hypothetical protein